MGNLVFDLIKSPPSCFPDTRDRREFDHLTFPPFGALLGQKSQPFPTHCQTAQFYSPNQKKLTLTFLFYPAFSCDHLSRLCCFCRHVSSSAACISKFNEHTAHNKTTTYFKQSFPVARYIFCFAYLTWVLFNIHRNHLFIYKFCSHVIYYTKNVACKYYFAIHRSYKFSYIRHLYSC